MYKKLNDQEVKIKKIVINSLRKYYKLQDEKDDLTVEMTAVSTSLLKISQDIHYLKPDKYFISAVLERKKKKRLYQIIHRILICLTNITMN